jgi:predicted outer membrane repeat protein
MSLRRCLGVWLLLFVSAPAGQALTIRVPQDQPQIKTAMDFASPGDSVIVSCGIYFESGISMKDDVVLRSETGEPECVRIDGDYNSAGLVCSSLQTGCKIEGITITRCERAILGNHSALGITKCNLVQNYAPPGEFSGHGGAIQLQYSDATISESVISQNHTSNGHQGDPPMGGGIWAYNSTLQVESTVFTENDAYVGGGIALWGNSSALIDDSSFLDNYSLEGGGGIYTHLWTGNLQVQNCRFQGNRGSILTHGQNGDEIVLIQDSDFLKDTSDFSVLSLNHCDSLVENSLFIGNTAPGGCLFTNNVRLRGITFASNLCSYGTIYVHDNFPGTVFLLSAIVALNTGPSIQCDANTSITLECCDLWGNTGGDWVDCTADQAGTHGNLSKDPLFCDVLEGDYTLRADSPCAPPQSGDCGLIGSEVIGCKPLSIEHRSWGSIKSLYR